MTDYCSGLPSVYGRNKLSVMIDRWESEQSSVASVCSEDLEGMRGVPATMLVALSANSMGPTEAITAAGFWEIGLYNVPAGSPAEDPPQPGSAYYRIAVGDEVRYLIGRSARVGRGRSGSWSTDIAGQTAVGIINYRDDGRSLISRISPSLRPGNEGSSWSVALSIMGYVESNGARRAISLFEQELLTYPEERRFAALCALVANRFEERGETDRSIGYPLVRAMQRMACGEELAKHLGQSTGWWPDYGPSRQSIEHWLTKSRYGDPSGCASALGPAIDNAHPLQETKSGSAAGVIVAVALTAAVVSALAGGYWWYKQRQE